MTVHDLDSSLAADHEPALDGLLVAGRYRQGQRVAATALYEVFEAWDEHLQRDVQLLLLRADLAEQRTSIGLFAATVAAAAELPHPSIPSVLDAGVDDTANPALRWAARQPVPDPALAETDWPDNVDLPTWADYIIRVASAVADAMRTVHSHGILHGALGPATIHATPPGQDPIQVRIDGFGPQLSDLVDLTDPDHTRRMWREFTASLTNPAPEQTAGQTPAPRTDIFGFGVALSLLVARAHAHAVPADPGVGIEDAEQRLQGLQALAERSASERPGARPYSFAAIEDELRALSVGARPRAIGSPEQIAPHTLVFASDDDLDTAILPPLLLASPPSASRAPHPPNPVSVLGADTLRTRLNQPLPERPHARGRTVTTVLLSIALVVAVAALAWFGFLRDQSTAAGKVTLPAVAGATIDDATATLIGVGLSAGGLREQPDPIVPAGLVAGTDPAAGTQLSAGTAVTLLVSTGPDLVTVPQLEGRSLADAQSVLEAAGLVAGSVRHRDSTQPEGTVLGSEPTFGTRITRGDPVAFTVATGRVTIPDEIVGQTPQAAAAQLQGLGLQVQTRRETTDVVAPGMVAGADPGTGTSVDLGGIVTLIVAVAPLPEPSPTPVPRPISPTPTGTPIPLPTDESDDEGDE